MNFNTKSVCGGLYHQVRTLLWQITNFELSVGNKIDLFVHKLKPAICDRVVETFNEVGRWEDFK